MIKHKLRRSIALSLTCTILYLAQAHGQAPGNWPLPHNDTEHSGWQKAETKLSKDTVAAQFKFLWKIKLENKVKGPTSFSEPLLAPRLINAEGFKDLVIWAGRDTVYAVDSELGTMVWRNTSTFPRRMGHAARTLCLSWWNHLTLSTSAPAVRRVLHRPLHRLRLRPEPDA